MTARMLDGAALAATMALALPLLAHPSTESFAKEKLTVKAGMNRCYGWCDKHNRLGSDKWYACTNQCIRYWRKNGSDAKSSN